MAFDFAKADAAKSEFSTAYSAYKTACDAEGVAQGEFDAAQAKLNAATEARAAADLELEYKAFALQTELAALDIVAQAPPEPVSPESTPPDPTPVE